MTDDRLIRALGKQKREEELNESEDPRWDALARGDLTDEELAALHAETDAETETHLAAFAPFDASELDHLTESAVGALAEGTEPKAAPVLALRPHAAKRPRLVMALVAAIAVAAGAFFFLRAPAADLPSYTLTVAGGDQKLRSTGATPNTEPLPLALGSTLDLVARPDRKIETPIEARAFFVQDGKLTPIAVALPRSPEGAFRLRATREVIFANATNGPATVLLAVGAPAELPAAPAKASDLEGARIQVLRQEVELTP